LVGLGQLIKHQFRLQLSQDNWLDFYLLRNLLQPIFEIGSLKIEHFGKLDLLPIPLHLFFCLLLSFALFKFGIIVLIVVITALVIGVKRLVLVLQQLHYLLSLLLVMVMGMDFDC